MIATLSDILSYEHPGVVNRFKKLYPAKAGEAEVIFKDLMRFFWGSEKHKQDQLQHPREEKFDFIYIMDYEMKYIDEMWHVFLLYTQDYAEFCEKYVGEFIHHLPDIVPGLPQDTEAFERNLERFLEYNLELLGEEVIARWFGEEVVV